MDASYHYGNCVDDGMSALHRGPRRDCPVCDDPTSLGAIMRSWAWRVRHVLIMAWWDARSWLTERVPRSLAWRWEDCSGCMGTGYSGEDAVPGGACRDCTCWDCMGGGRLPSPRWAWLARRIGPV